MMTNAQFSQQCSYLASEAAHWAGDTLTLPETIGEPLPGHVLERFLGKFRERLDRIEAWANETPTDGALTQEEWRDVRNADMVLIGKLQDALLACAAMLAFLRERDGECLGDHPAWMRRIDGIFDAHAAVIASPVPVRNGDDGQSVLGGEAEARTGGATPPTGSIPWDTVGPFQRGHIARPERDETPPNQPSDTQNHPDRGMTDALAEKLLWSLKRMLEEFDLLIEAGHLPDIRNDVIFPTAREAVAEADAAMVAATEADIKPDTGGEEYADGRDFTQPYEP
jgi:hypothetical protein